MVMSNFLRVLVLTVALALTASLLVLGGPPTNKAQAQTDPERFIINLSSQDLAFNATIKTPDGRTCTSTGTASLFLSKATHPTDPPLPETFHEHFTTPFVTTCDSGQPQPGLDGETFFITDPNKLTVSGTCDPSATSTIDFTASGMALGFYGGTFTESGTVTLNSTGVVSLTANFTIDSPTGQVTGTKEFVTGSSTGGGNCSPLPSADEVAPTTTATRSVEPNAAGWNKEDVTVTLAATDNEGGSGVKEITYSINGGQPTTEQGNSVQVPVTAEGETTIAFNATDNEGNTEVQKTTTVKIDRKAVPSQANADRYSNSSPITVNYTTNAASDTSGLAKVELWAKGPQDADFSKVDEKSTATDSFSYTVNQGDGDYRFYTIAEDNAGNREVQPPSADAIVTVTHDTAAPTSTATPDQAANGNGWHKADLTVSLNAGDGQGSGVKELLYSATGADPISQQTVSAADLPVNYPVDAEGTTTISFYAVDQAGNPEATKTFEVKLDKTAPTITGSRSPAANANGWNNENVTVGWNCDDALSGVPSCPAAVILSSEGVDQSVTRTLTDAAGNTASTTVSNINIDKTAPSAPAADTNPANPVAGSDGWFKDSVIVSYSGGSDPQLADGSPGSGIDASTYSASQTFDTSSDSHHYSGTVQDKAGNTSNPVSDTVKVDATDPSLDITGCPSALVARDSIQKLTVTANDAHSGLATDSSGDLQLNTSTAGSHTETVTATDKVGHSTTKECTYTVNSTPSKPGTPTLSATSSTPNQGSYTLNWDASSDTDNNLDHYVLQHKNSTTGAQFRTVDDNVNGASYSFGSDGNQPEEEGTWTYRVRALDSLGEASEDSNESNAVKVDQSKPNAPLESAGPADYTDQNGDKWYKDSATVSFAANGDPPLADGSDGSGVKSVSDPVSLNSSGVLNYSGKATDNAGNESDATSGSVKVDAEAPTSNASAKDSANNDYNSGDWTNKDVTVTLSASDDQGSGVKHIAYSVNGNADTAAGSSKQITVSDKGTTTITFHAVDNVGKEEAQQHTFTIKIDKTAPTITGSRSPDANSFGWNNENVTVSFTCSDELSGLDSSGCPANVTLASEGADQSVTRTVTDAAGNSASDTVDNINIDKTAPSVFETIPQAGDTNVSRTIQGITATFAPGGSGIDPNTLTYPETVQLFSGNSSKPAKATLSEKTSNSVTLTPSSKLDANKTYTAKIKGGATGVKDLADNPLASDFSWTFTTGAR